MTKEQIFTDVQEIICDYMAVFVEEVTYDANLQEDLGMDSLEIIHVVGQIEEKFDIRIDDDKIFGLNMVGDYVEEIFTQCNNKK
jgi:acyl carrier protein